jgi:ankyrin repeat protein
MARWAVLLLSLCAAGCGILHDTITGDVNEELVYAARNGDVHSLERLAAHGLDLDAPKGATHWTALQHAVHKEQAGSVRVLLEWGADPDATVSGNTTPLFMAADSTDPAMAELLIDAGADVDWHGPGGRTPLTQAISGGALWDVTDRPILGGCRPRTVRALLAAGARRTPATRAWNQAIYFARLHDCEDVLALAGTWTDHSTLSKIVTTGGVVKDALGIRSPKDLREGK